jgi:hypothetical protein
VNVLAPGAACLLVVMVSAPLQAQDIVLRAGTLLDGRGGVSRSVNVVVEGAMHIRPDGLFWGGIQPDEGHWINRCVASYYGPASVRIPNGRPLVLTSARDSCPPQVPALLGGGRARDTSWSAHDCFE